CFQTYAEKSRLTVAKSPSRKQQKIRIYRDESSDIGAYLRLVSTMFMKRKPEGKKGGISMINERCCVYPLFSINIRSQ
ncbi:MAG: hypothetical protein L0I86_13850, partial [Enterobacterales bacterium]|nr:hypothetical protein [Enterobacterales bacterium]